MLSMLVLVVAAADAGSPLIADWAQHPTYTLHAHVTCDQPDAGIFVTRFREPQWFELGDACEFSPLRCPTPEGRDEVLRQLDAGTLRFAEPVVTVQPDADGWVTLPAHADDALRVECGDRVNIFAAWPLSTEAIEVRARDLSRTELPPDIVRLAIVNPFSREVRGVSRAEFAQLSDRVLEGAWIVAQRERGEWSGPVLPGEGIGNFPPAEPKSFNLGHGTDWGVDGGTPMLIVVNAPGVTPREMGVAVTFPDTMRAVAEKRTHANGARFLIPRGKWDVLVMMSGAFATRVGVTVDEQPLEVPITLFPGVSGVVVNEAGKPVERACVTISDRGGCEAWTDRDGEFSLGAFANPAWLRATHPFVGSSAKVKVGGPIKLTLRASSRAVLRVPLINGRPARGWLELDPPKEGSSAAMFKAPEKGRAPIFEGDITLADLPPGKHTVVLSAPGYEPQTIAVQAAAKRVTTVRVPAWKPSLAQ